MRLKQLHDRDVRRSELDAKNPGKMVMAIALCVVAIVAAIYMGIHTFVQPKPEYPKGFDMKYGPSGPPRPGGPGGMPGRPG
jgi:hypothetical protein